MIIKLATYDARFMVCAQEHIIKAIRIEKDTENEYLLIHHENKVISHVPIEQITKLEVTDSD